MYMYEAHLCGHTPQEICQSAFEVYNAYAKLLTSEELEAMINQPVKTSTSEEPVQPVVEEAAPAPAEEAAPVEINADSLKALMFKVRDVKGSGILSELYQKYAHGAASFKRVAAEDYEALYNGALEALNAAD